MPSKRNALTALEKDNLRRAKQNRERVRRECARAANAGWPEQFERLQAELLARQPKLRLHKHCGLCPDSDQPRRRVVLPNGIVLWSSWYKYPTTDADLVTRRREQEWLRGKAGREWYAATFASMRGDLNA